jgi:hypothetical protein
MLPKIERSERFQAEYKSFQDKINSVEDENYRAELAGLLKDLLLSVRALDEQHIEITANQRFPVMINDLRDKVSDVRKTLTKKLSAYANKKAQI